MNRQVLSIVCGLAGGLVAGYLTFALGLVGFVITLAACVAIVVFARVYMPYRMPWRTHAALLKELDPRAGPPAAAQPATSELFANMQSRARENDWAGLQALLADDFKLRDARNRPWGAKVYIRTLQLMRRAYPDLTSTTDQILVDPAEPDVLWLQTSTLGHPKHGPVLDSTSWSRLTVTPDHQRARELASGGVNRVA